MDGRCANASGRSSLDSQRLLLAGQRHKMSLASRRGTAGA